MKGRHTGRVILKLTQDELLNAYSNGALWLNRIRKSAGVNHLRLAK